MFHVPIMELSVSVRVKVIGCAEVRSASIATDAPPASAHPIMFALSFFGVIKHLHDR